VLQWGESVPFPHVANVSATALTCGDGVTAVSKDYPLDFVPTRAGAFKPSARHGIASDGEQAPGADAPLYEASMRQVGASSTTRAEPDYE